MSEIERGGKLGVVVNLGWGHKDIYMYKSNFGTLFIFTECVLIEVGECKYKHAEYE